MDIVNVFAGDLSFFCSEQDLVNLFHPFGVVKSVIVRRGKNGDTLHYAFLKMPESVALEAIKHLRGIKFMGRKLRIGLNIPNQPQAGLFTEDNRSLWAQIYVNFQTKAVRNQINEDFLGSIFAQVGSVADCIIKHYNFDMHPHRQSGYGFVYYFSIEDANEAVNRFKQRTVDGIHFDCNVCEKPAASTTAIATEESVDGGGKKEFDVDKNCQITRSDSAVTAVGDESTISSQPTVNARSNDDNTPRTSPKPASSGVSKSLQSSPVPTSMARPVSHPVVRGAVGSASPLPNRTDNNRPHSYSGNNYTQNQQGNNGPTASLSNRTTPQQHYQNPQQQQQMALGRQQLPPAAYQHPQPNSPLYQDQGMPPTQAMQMPPQPMMYTGVPMNPQPYLIPLPSQPMPFQPQGTPSSQLIHNTHSQEGAFMNPILPHQMHVSYYPNGSQPPQSFQSQPPQHHHQQLQQGNSSVSNGYPSPFPVMVPGQPPQNLLYAPTAGVLPGNPAMFNYQYSPPPGAIYQQPVPYNPLPPQQQLRQSSPQQQPQQPQQQQQQQQQHQVRSYPPQSEYGQQPPPQHYGQHPSSYLHHHQQDHYSPSIEPNQQQPSLPQTGPHIQQQHFVSTMGYPSAVSTGPLPPANVAYAMMTPSGTSTSSQQPQQHPSSQQFSTTIIHPSQHLQPQQIHQTLPPPAGR